MLLLGLITTWISCVVSWGKYFTLLSHDKLEFNHFLMEAHVCGAAGGADLLFLIEILQHLEFQWTHKWGKHLQWVSSEEDGDGIWIIPLELVVVHCSCIACSTRRCSVSCNASQTKPNLHCIYKIWENSMHIDQPVIKYLSVSTPSIWLRGYMIEHRTSLYRFHNMYNACHVV